MNITCESVTRLRRDLLVTVFFRLKKNYFENLLLTPHYIIASMRFWEKDALSLTYSIILAALLCRYMK